MSVLPDNGIDQIAFCEAHLPVWTTNPTSVGLTAAAVAKLSNDTKSARAAYDAAQAARQASKAATTTYQANLTVMRGQVSDMLKNIKAFAASSTNPPAVYAAAQIPEPLPPTPQGAPGTPTDITVGLNPDGSVTIKWKATDASVSSGAIFDVSRRVGISGPYVGVGSSVPAGRSAFSFTDSTLAFGTDLCSYIITPRRGTKVGTPSPSVNVQLGTAGAPGNVSISGVSSPLKMAA